MGVRFPGLHPTQCLPDLSRQRQRQDPGSRPVELGMNIALRGNQALDFGAGYFSSAADRGSARYGGATFRIAYLHRFR